jgi:G1/S-specific cyclin PLC1
MLSLDELNTLALERFAEEPISSQLIQHVASKAIGVIQCEELKQGATSLEGDLPPLESFITSLICKSNVQVIPVMSCLVYLDRLKQNLPPDAKGGRYTVHRIFFATLVVADKFLSDFSPKNKQWSSYSYIQAHKDFGFSRAEVNLMEKQLLYLLDWKLMVSRSDICYYSEPFLASLRQEILDKKVKWTD